MCFDLLPGNYGSHWLIVGGELYGEIRFLFLIDTSVLDEVIFCEIFFCILQLSKNPFLSFCYPCVVSLGGYYGGVALF